MDAWCEQKAAELVYGGGCGGGGGGQFGRDVVRRLIGGDCSSDGAGEDDEVELVDGRRLVVCSRTWARLLELTNEGDSLDCGSTIGARLIGCRLCDLLRFRIRIFRRWSLWSKLLSSYSVLVELYSLPLFPNPNFSKYVAK
jgi:hypothetical protein